MDLDIVKLDPGLENRSDKIWLSANLSAVYADRLDNSWHCHSNVIENSLWCSGAYEKTKQKRLGILRSFLVHYSCPVEYTAHVMLI